MVQLIQLNKLKISLTNMVSQSLSKLLSVVVVVVWELLEKVMILLMPSPELDLKLSLPSVMVPVSLKDSWTDQNILKFNYWLITMVMLFIYLKEIVLFKEDIKKLLKLPQLKLYQKKFVMLSWLMLLN